jgi:hypothetical protein
MPGVPRQRKEACQRRLRLHYERGRLGAGTGTGDDARTEAKNGTGGGSAVNDSYLVTITSRLENAIAVAAAGYKGSWIGAYRPNVASLNWYWADGPEGGAHFFTQISGGGGSATGGYYANFGAGEPNGSTAPGGETRGSFSGRAASGTTSSIPPLIKRAREVSMTSSASSARPTCPPRRSRSTPAAARSPSPAPWGRARPWPPSNVTARHHGDQRWRRDNGGRPDLFG